LIAEFLDFLYGEVKGYVDIVTRSDSGTLDNERWFEWPRERSVAIKYIELRETEDVYASVAVFSDKQRTKGDARAVTRVAYADADTCPPSKFRVAPTLSLETSANRWHAFWLLDEAVSIHDASEASHRIAKAHAEDG
jgi:hypothetical protein